LLSLLICISAHAQELRRSQMTGKFWIEGAIGNSPDSGIFHGETSAVADRKDFTLRYQHGALGVLANYHHSRFDSNFQQESYKVNNSIFGLGVTLRWAPFADKSGLLA